MSLLIKKIYAAFPKEGNERMYKDLEGTNLFLLHGDIISTVESLPRDKQKKLICKAFLGLDDGLDAVLSDPLDQEINLPFDNCFFELLIPLDIGFSITSAIQIKELGPETFKVNLFSKFDHVIPMEIYKGKIKLEINKVETNLSLEQRKKIEAKCASAVKFIVGAILTVLNEKTEYGVTKENFVLKKGFGVKAYRTEVNKIIHIRVGKTVKQTEHLGQKIDWSHRWMVRGHWRKISAVGKDRNGDYGVKGFTWVVEHVKGPEELPIIEKTRIIHNLSEAHA